MKNGANHLALVLGGGGARAAYQAGVLRGLARHFPDLHFPIVTGVSAGSINSAFLANHTDNLPSAAAKLAERWANITVSQVFRASTYSLATNVLRWGLRLIGGGSPLAPPTRGFVDTAPLREFFTDCYQTRDGTLHGVAENIRRGKLRAAAITTTDYATTQSVTWVQGEQLEMWERPLRRSKPTELTVEHVMASCALPLFFPAIKLGKDWHGDGGVRLTAPLSPALHLGAERILVVSTRHPKTFSEAEHPVSRNYPPPAAIMGVLMNSIFLDMLDYDVRTLTRFNQLARELASEKRQDLRVVEVMVVRPSVDISMLAAEHEKALPGAFRFMERGLGTRGAQSGDLLATLMFVPEYTQRLLEIGEKDAEKHRDGIAVFLTDVSKETIPKNQQRSCL